MLRTLGEENDRRRGVEADHPKARHKKGTALEIIDEQPIPGEVPGAPAEDVNMTPGPAEEFSEDEYEGMEDMIESSDDEETKHEPATST